MSFTYQIDALDKSILSILIENAKTPYTEVAEKLKISHGTVHQRVKKLEKRGIIKKSSIVIDYDKLGYKFILFLGLIVSQGKGMKNVTKQLSCIPQITVAHITSGRHNITCKIRAEDSKHAAKIIDQINAIDGVIRTESTVSFEEFINSKDQLMQAILS